MNIGKILGLVVALSFPPVTLGLEADSDHSVTVVWLSNDAGTSKHEGSDRTAPYEADSLRTMVGVDHSFNNQFGVSVGIGKGRSSAEPVGREKDESRSTDWRIAAQFTPEDWVFSAAVYQRKYRTDRARAIVLPIREITTRLLLDARIDSEESGVDLTASRSFDLGETWWLSPAFGISYVRIETDDFIEQIGARSVLEVATEPENSWISSADLSVGTIFFAGSWAVLPVARIGVEYLVDGDNEATVTTFVGTRYGYESEGFDADRTRFSLDGGLAVRHLGGFGARFKLSHDRQSNYRQTGLSLTLEYGF